MKKLIAVVCLASTMASAPVMADQTFFTLSGNGMKNTRPVTIGDGWEFQWDASGNIFQVYVNDPEGIPAGVLANQQGAGSGASYETKGGTFTFTINAMGTWTIRIVQVTNESETPPAKPLSSLSDPR